MESPGFFSEECFDLLPVSSPAEPPNYVAAPPPQKRARTLEPEESDVILAQGTVPRQRRSASEMDPATGAWTNVRLFHRKFVSVANAEKIEDAVDALPGTYFVSMARKRIDGMVQLHNRWITRMTNKGSGYVGIQGDLQSFFAKMLAEFDTRYALYKSDPAFNTICVVRRRNVTQSN